MKSSQRLDPIIDKARKNEEVAARALAEARNRHEGAQQKLAELETYRTEYVEGLHYKSRAGLNAMQMKDYQAFLGRLDEAIRQQQQVLASFEQEAAQVRERWLQEKQRLSALGKLGDRHRQRERLDSDRLEQLETNEHALQRWRRVPG
jgi:flagellar FliJ protein